MSLDSNHNVVPRVHSYFGRALLAVLIALAISIGWVAQAWSYSASEIQSVESDREQKIRDLRDQEVTQIRIALGRRLDKNRRADLYLRLSELYLEAYRVAFLLEGRVYEERLKRGQKDAKIDRSYSHPIIQKGISAVEEILNLRLEYSKLDQVYYFAAVYYAELDEHAKSLGYYEKIIRQFPQSPFASMAYAEIGFDAYTNKKYAKSEEYLKTASDRLDGPEGARALHRLAWSYYRTRRFDLAVSTLKKAIDRVKNGDEKLVSLRDEALRDMAIFMTESGKIDEAVSYFKSVSGDEGFYGRALEKLARQYERNVQVEAAVKVYETLSGLTKSDDVAFRAQVKLIDIDLRKKNFESVAQRLKRTQMLTGAPLKGVDEETQTAYQNLKAMIRRTATEAHELFRKNKDKLALERADQFYSLYLEKFLARSEPVKERPEIQMYLAEVKRDRGAAAGAAELYRAVISSKDPRYTQEATALWTASLAEQITLQKKQAKEKRNEPSDLEEQFIEAVDDLQEQMGESNEGRELQLRAAQVLAGYPSSRKKAVKRARKIIESAPSSAQANVAARLWLQTLSDQLPEKMDPEKVDSDVIEDLGAVLSEIRKNTVLTQNDATAGKGKLAVQIAELENRVRVLSIAKFEKTNNKLEAARGYEEFANQATDPAQLDKAYSNAFYNYFASDDLESAERVSHKWKSRRKESAKAISDSWQTAITQAFIEGRFETSALGFELSDGQESAARLYEAIGNSEKAIRLTKALQSKQPKHAGYLADLGRLYRHSNRDSEAAKVLSQCLDLGSDSASAGCGWDLAELYHLSSDLKGEVAVLRRLSSLKSKSARDEIAYAHFRLGQIELAQKRFSALEMPESKLQAGIADRLKFFKTWNQTMSQAIQMGGPWAIAALNQLAKWSYDFAEEIDRIPSSVHEDEKRTQALTKSVSQISAPLKAKALSIWSDALNRSEKEGILSPVNSEIQDRMVELGAKTLMSSQGSRKGMKVTGMDPSGGKEGGASALQKVRARLLKKASDSDAWVDYGNLIWGQGKPLLAELSYERALSLNPKNTSALVNRGVVELGQYGIENLRSAQKADYWFSEALKFDSFSQVAKFNSGFLSNYYRLFNRSMDLWKGVADRTQAPDAYLGLAIAEWGTAKKSQAQASLKKALGGGVPKDSFGVMFLRASIEASSGQYEECQSIATEILSEASPEKFERESTERLQRWCEKRRDG